jgi:hypothetical protein
MEEPRKSKSQIKQERKEKVKQTKSGNKTNMRQPYNQTKNKKQMSTYGFIFYSLSIFLVVVAILWIATPEPKIIFTKDLTLNELRDTSGYPTPDFEIKKKGVYEIEVNCLVPYPIGSSTYSSELAVDVELFDSSDVKVNEFSGDLYSAAGYSDGESWRENATTAKQQFLIEQPGKYSAEIFATRDVTLQNLMYFDSLYRDPATGYSQYIKVEKKDPIPFIFRVKEGSTLMSEYMGWLFIIFGVIWFCMIFGFSENK